MAEKEALKMVRKDEPTLQCVAEQTPEICLAAVQENGMALWLVEEQTPEICLAAVRQNGLALEYVEKQTDEICEAAVKQNKAAAYYVENAELRRELENRYCTYIDRENTQVAIEESGKSIAVSEPAEHEGSSSTSTEETEAERIRQKTEEITREMGLAE